MKRHCRILLVLLLVVPVLAFAEEAQDADKEKGPLSGLEYRLIGPSVGGRLAELQREVGPRRPRQV